MSKLKFSDAQKIAIVISVFFLINSTISMNIALLPSFASYILGFSVGILSGYVGLMMLKRRKVFEASDVQIDIALDLCKQFSAVQGKLVKATPSEVYHLICAAKVHFPEAKPILESKPDVTDVVATVSA